MAENKIKNLKSYIQHYLNRERSQELLLKRATAKYGMTYQDSDFADMELYTTFRPIHAVNSISEADYMKTEFYKEAYMNVYIKMYKQFKRHPEEYSQYYQDIYDNTGEININEFNNLLNRISNDWAKFYSKSNKYHRTPAPGIQLKNIALSEFFCLNPETRKNLSKIAQEKTFAQDCEIYTAYQPEIEGLKGISFIEFIQNKDLKAEYRQKTSWLAAELEEKKKEPVKFEDVMHKVSYASKEWVEFIECMDEAVENGGKFFATKYPLEKFSLKDKEEKQKLQRIVTQLTVAKITKQQQNIELNDMFKDVKKASSEKVEQR